MAKKSTEKWHPITIEHEIIASLLTEENRGEMLNSDLFRKLQITYPSLTVKDMNKILFNLEVRSYIFVIPIKKNVSNIQITKNAPLSQEYKRLAETYTH